MCVCVCVCFNQTGDIFTLNGSYLKLADKFTYLGSCVSSTYTGINTWPPKARTAINNLSVIWKSDLTDKIKRSFFQAAVVSILLYGCTTWTLTKRMKKRIDGNYTIMMRAILNKSWWQHPTTKTIKITRIRLAAYCWRNRDVLIRDVLQWTPSHRRAKAGCPAWTYIQQLCADRECSPEDLPNAMDDRESGKGGYGISVPMAWHDIYIYTYIYIYIYIYKEIGKDIEKMMSVSLWTQYINLHIYTLNHMVLNR